MFTGLSPFATVLTFVPSGIGSFVFDFFAVFAGDGCVPFPSSWLFDALAMWLELMTATPPCRLLIALKAIIPATATTCSKSTIKSARESFMFGSERSSKSAPAAVARRVVAARNFFLRVKIVGNFIAFIWARHGRDAGIGRPGQRSS